MCGDVAGRQYPRRTTRIYYVYIMASRSRVLYTGVTNDLSRRVLEHKHRANPGFTSRYNVTRLVHCERFRTRSSRAGHRLLRKMTGNELPAGDLPQHRRLGAAAIVLLGVRTPWVERTTGRRPGR